MKCSIRQVAGAVIVALLLFPSLPCDAATVPKPFSREGWERLVATRAGMGDGRPLIVHFWGLSCPPCIVEMPEWGRFVAEHGAVRVVFVNWDRRQEPPQRIAMALERAGLSSIEHWSLADAVEEKARFAVDPDWFGELPHTRLIRPDGTTRSYSGTSDFGQLRSWAAGQMD